jgi:hypothetical protein
VHFTDPTEIEIEIDIAIEIEAPWDLDFDKTIYMQSTCARVLSGLPGLNEPSSVGIAEARPGNLTSEHQELY